MEQWQSWSEFWAMGGAGPYVWGSYTATAVLIVAELLLVFRRRSAVVRHLQRLRRVSVPQPGRRLEQERL